MGRAAALSRTSISLCLMLAGSATWEPASGIATTAPHRVLAADRRSGHDLPVSLGAQRV